MISNSSGLWQKIERFKQSALKLREEIKRSNNLWNDSAYSIPHQDLSHQSGSLYRKVENGSE